MLSNQSSKICAEDILFLYEKTLAANDQEFAIRVGRLGAMGGDAYPLSHPGYFMPTKAEDIIWPNDIDPDKLHIINNALSKFHIDQNSARGIEVLDDLMRKSGSKGIIFANKEAIASRMQFFIEEIVDQWVLNPNEPQNQPVLILEKMRNLIRSTTEYKFGDVAVTKFGTGAAREQNIHTQIDTHGKSHAEIVTSIVLGIKRLREQALSQSEPSVGVQPSGFVGRLAEAETDGHELTRGGRRTPPIKRDGSWSDDL